MKDTIASLQTILVTGANGQLGKEIQQSAKLYPSYKFLFTTKTDLPIDDFQLVTQYFEAQKIDYCINCAAYTAVDKAETERERAFLINAYAVENLATICSHHQTHLIHISTDYVFNGTSSRPYKEEDIINPVNTYGASKLKGEELALSKHPSALIIRTSWVYSSFGNNFVKTMLRLYKEKESINVVNDQYGCPTYAADIADVIMKIIDHSKTGWVPGIVNYCNDGITNWYKFAVAIKEITKSSCIVNPIPSSAYKTPATRPQFSVLDTAKIRQVFGIVIPHWKHSLQKCLSTLAD